MENNNSLMWLNGLQDYLEFADSLETKKIVEFLSVLVNSNVLIIDEDNMSGMIYALSKLRNQTNEPIFNIFHKYYRSNINPDPLKDAFSRGQVKSKIWLVTELLKIKNNFDCIYLLAGWFGQLRLFLDIANIEYNRLRVIDIDPEACRISDQIFNVDRIENYKVKSVELDLNDMSWLFRTGGQYNIKNYSNDSCINEKTIPDLVINTSAEHFHDGWYHKFVSKPQPTDPLFVIQSNNLHNVPDHINCVHHLEEMKKKFPMTRIEFEGELQLPGYTRFMLIGRP